MKSSKGFTLIELLIAITIIAILTAVGMANYKTASQKARDSRRQSELEQIRSALELYRSDFGKYPAKANMPASCGAPFLLDPADVNSNTYIEDMPCDPKEGTMYEYEVSGTQFKYELGATFEVKGDTSACSMITNPDINYCVKNP